MKKKIIIVSGDPNSINSEIIFKSWRKLNKQQKKSIFLISNYNLLKAQFKKLNYKIKLKKIENINCAIGSDVLKIINVKVNFRDPFKIPKKISSKFFLNSIKLAHNLAIKDKRVAGLINCPVNKNLLNKTKGVTELLASMCSIKKDTEAMMIMNKQLMVSPITTHLDIKLISKKLDKKIIIKKIITINKFYKKIFKKKPRIAILGLNPHNAEYRRDSEEKKIIIPAIKKLKNLGIFLKGPFVSDTIFIEDYKKYDVIVGMYHDQVLSPFKTLFKFDAINLTLGLKYLRVSPDHGVAVDKILLKKSNPESLLRCIKFLYNSYK